MLTDVDNDRCFLRYSEDISFLTHEMTVDFMTKRNWTGNPDSIFMTEKSTRPGNACQA